MAKFVSTNPNWKERRRQARPKSLRGQDTYFWPYRGHDGTDSVVDLTSQ